MLFRENDQNNGLPTIVLLHGGGLSNWSVQKVSEVLQSEYRVVTPIVEGHGENADETFVSIEHSAKNLMKYIETHCDGKVFALCGLSLGAQIIVEALSVNGDIADFVVIDGALVIPIRRTAAIMARSYKLFFGLIKKRWFSRMQARALFVGGEFFDRYYADSMKMTKQSLINVTISNGDFTTKSNLHKTKANVLILVGGKEPLVMRKSATILHGAIPGSQRYIAPKMRHGELSLARSQEYGLILKRFFAGERLNEGQPP